MRVRPQTSDHPNHQSAHVLTAHPTTFPTSSRHPPQVGNSTPTTPRKLHGATGVRTGTGIPNAIVPDTVPAGNVVNHMGRDLVGSTRLANDAEHS